MFDIIRNYALPEFWAFWGIPFGSVVVAALAGAYSVMFALTPAARRIGIEIAAAALFCGFIYGLGGAKRDALCTAQVDAYQAEFVKMQDKINQATAKHAQELADTISTAEQANANKVKQITDRLAETESGSCMPSDEFLNGVRQLRTKGAAAGKQ